MAATEDNMKQSNLIRLPGTNFQSDSKPTISCSSDRVPAMLLKRTKNGNWTVEPTSSNPIDKNISEDEAYSVSTELSDHHGDGILNETKPSGLEYLHRCSSHINGSDQKLDAMSLESDASPNEQLKYQYLDADFEAWLQSLLK